MPNPGPPPRSTLMGLGVRPVSKSKDLGRILMNASATNPSAFGSVINIFLEPKKTFEDLRNHASWWWLPVVLLIGLSLVFQVWYANRVDVSWFADQTLAPQ